MNMTSIHPYLSYANREFSHLQVSVSTCEGINKAEVRANAHGNDPNQQILSLQPTLDHTGMNLCVDPTSFTKWLFRMGEDLLRNRVHQDLVQSRITSTTLAPLTSKCCGLGKIPTPSWPCRSKAQCHPPCLINNQSNSLNRL